MIYIVLGVSGCGKSSVGKLLAQRFSLPFFDADDFHSESNKQKMASGTPLTDEDRGPWLLELSSLLAREEQNEGAVLACSGLKQSYRELLASKLSGRAEFIYLQGSFNTILNRMKKRSNHFMDPSLLQSQFETLEEPNDAITIDIELSLDRIVESIEENIAGLVQS